MAVTPVPAIGTVPAFPSLADRPNYNTLAYAWATYMRTTFPTDMQALANNVVLNATDAYASAASAGISQGASSASQIAAAQSAVDAAAYTAQAVNAQNAANASANYKGTWASLGSGSVTKPASISHNGVFYALIPASLANVSTVQPGVTGGWASTWQPIPFANTATALVTATGTALINTRSIITAATAITLTAPTGVNDGDYFGFRNASGVLNHGIDFGSQKLRGVAVGVLTLDVLYAELDLYYKNSTVGWV